MDYYIIDREMFYNYLKSIYNILEKCDSESHNFQSMLKMNEYFLKNFKRPNNKKSHKVLNDIYNLYQTGGGTPIEELGILKDSIFKILDEFDKIVQTPESTKDIDELEIKIKSIKSAIENLVRYIDLLHTFVPNKTDITKLGTQLQEINSILTKYTN